MELTVLSRLRSLLILAGVALAASCAAPAADPIAPAADLSGPSALSVAVTTNDFGTGNPRVPFVLFRGVDPLPDATSVAIEAFDLSSGTPVPGWRGDATAFTDYDIPYWVVFPALPHAGYWGLAATVTLAEGSQATAQFTVKAEVDPSAPEVGEAAPLSRNRTLASEPDLKLLTSDPRPEPKLYSLTVAEAVTTGRPTVVVFGTPAFCASRLCAPVVDSVKSVRAEFGDRANFIHIEVYKSFDPLVYADEMNEWHLTSEPWTFVLDSEGRVRARLGGPVSPQELAAQLQPLIAAAP